MGPVRASLGIRGRLALAIVLTAVIPLGAAIVFARTMVQQASERFFVPEVRENLERAYQMYDLLARTTKSAMRHEADAISRDQALLRQVAAGDPQAIQVRLKQLLARHQGLLSLSVEGADGQVLAQVQRDQPFDENEELQLAVPRPLLLAKSDGTTENDHDGELMTPTLTVVLATDKERFEGHSEMGEFVDAYSKLEQRRASDERTYVLAFAALLGLTILSATGVGSLLARGVTRRVSELALATRQVGAGDLSIRVDEDSLDEIGDLGRAFNRMLTEVAASRERIEYLSRLASWQEMARRLAHEIKNPLTPIQLAVEEVHQRLANITPEQRKLLDAALEIVQSEVQTLRRLVGEFSQFARLPESRLEAGDLTAFLREMEQESQLAGGLAFDDSGDESGAEPQITFEVPSSEMAGHFDRQLLRRVFINLARNAAAACRGRERPVHLNISAKRKADRVEILFDDDGPGVAPELRSAIFEPYVTTREDGTGLGLAIVKKIVMEHQGHIELVGSPLGGARVRLNLPLSNGRSPSLEQKPAKH